MKSIDNLTLIQIINRYKDIIGDDLESFIYSKIFDDKIIQSIEESIQNRVILNTDEERQRIAYQLLMEILKNPQNSLNTDNSIKRQFIAEIMKTYPDRIKTGTKKEMKDLILDGKPIAIYEFPSQKYRGIRETLIFTKEEPKSIDSIYDEKKRKLFKEIMDTITIEDISSIIKPEYKDAVLGAIMKKITMQYFVDKKGMKPQDFKEMYLDKVAEDKETIVKLDDKDAGICITELLQEYVSENFYLMDREAILLNAAARLMLGVRVCEGEQVGDLILRNNDESKKQILIECSILEIRKILKELKTGKYTNAKYKVVDNDGETIIEADEKNIEEFLARCTDTRYLSDLYIDKLHANLAVGTFPENLEELKIAGVGLEDVTHIIESYEEAEDKDEKEKLLTSANALERYLLRNTELKEEDFIDLYVNGNANLELIEQMKLGEMPKEYFDTRFMELFSEDVYFDTKESNTKLKRYANLYSVLREQEQIDTTTDDLVVKLSGMFGEEFIPNIMGELYKTGIADIEEAMQWLGGEFIATQYKQEVLQPVEIREMYNKGKIDLQELAGMISLLEDNTEKFMVISSLFPEAESIEIRQELFKRCLELGDSLKEDDKGTKRKKGKKSDNKYDQYITDPEERFKAAQLLDKEYSLKMTSDGHAIMHLPNLQTVWIEKMLDKDGNPYYGAASYFVNEEYFEKNKDTILVEDKVKRRKLSQNSESKSIEKLIHSPTGWVKGVKRILKINEETRTPEELQEIENAMKSVKESRRKIERE
jgi:hypothetical protein